MSTNTSASADTGSIPINARTGTVGFVIAILLIAANLRATLTGVGVLLPEIEATTGMSSVWSGLLTTLPLLTFAATSPFVGRFTHRLGASRLMVLALIALALGTVIRSLPSITALFLGTIILSAAIAFGNVLLPSLVRRHIPANRVHAISSLYVTVMALVAGVSSGISVPLANALPGGWRTALAWGLVLTVVALVVWLPRLRTDGPQAASPAGGVAGVSARMPWRSGLAWNVSIFMGLQSLAFYSVIAWLPSILVGSGIDAAQAGWMLFFFQVVGLLSSLALPALTRGRLDQRYTAAGAAALVTAGFLVLLLPGQGILACVLLGLGGGAVLVLALSFQSQRADGHLETAALAGMAQSIGYLVAALGPLLLGVLHDATGTWTIALVILAGLGILMAVTGYNAGRDGQIPTGAFAR